MTLPADIAEIEARHSDIGRSGRRTITKAFEDAHNDRATLLRAYRELATEHVNENERLRALNAKLFEAGWRAAADWARRDDLISDIGSPAYLAGRAKALAELG